MARLYTGTGDEGETSLGDLSRVSKSAARVAAYGDIDELNSAIGVALAVEGDLRVQESLLTIQGDLFALGAELSLSGGGSGPPLIGKRDIARLERLIDEFEAENEPLRYFILPGGSLRSAHLHLSRTICRRSERSLVALGASGSQVRPETIIYLNRLSDALFSMARYENKVAGVADETWHGSQ